MKTKIGSFFILFGVLITLQGCDKHPKFNMIWDQNHTLSELKEGLVEQHLIPVDAEMSITSTPCEPCHHPYLNNITATWNRPSGRSQIDLEPNDAEKLLDQQAIHILGFDPTLINRDNNDGIKTESDIGMTPEGQLYYKFSWKDLRPDNSKSNTTNK